MRSWQGFICISLATIVLGNQPRALPAGEIGWIENFSLATDRTGPLQQLIPGTEDYYYFHCLHYQNTEQWEKVDDTLKSWVDRYKWTPRAIEIQNRQALLTYKQNPQRALDLIRQRLNLQFNHQREQLNQKPNLPTKLDPALLEPHRLNQLAFAQFPNSLQGFEEAALDWLVAVESESRSAPTALVAIATPRLSEPGQADHRRSAFANSGGFGQFEIHRRLLLSQLDECLKLKPDLHLRRELRQRLSAAAASVERRQLAARSRGAVRPISIGNGTSSRRSAPATTR